MSGLILDALTFAVAVVFPLHLTVSALTTSSAAQTRSALCFWVVSAVLSACEELCLGALAYVPFWSTIKLLFLLWAVAPQTNGAVFLYDSYCSPLLSSLTQKPASAASSVAAAAQLSAPAAALAKAKAFVQRASR